jgi:hypothetical protein
VADPRELWIAGQGKRNVEDARRKAAANTPQVMMSQTPEWYTTLSPEGKRENLSRAKDVLQHMPAVTTDQNESRNMYQMLMNQMKGGDKGARLIDTRGLPAGARRIGRTLFTDPAKSQGFFGDVGSLFTGKNKAAVRAKEYNPFPKAGFGEQFYKDEFPWASAFGNITGLAEKSPTLSMLASLFPKKERIPLERDPRYTPVDGSADWESSVFDPIEGEFEEEIDLSPGTDWYGPYNEDWEKLQAYLRGDMERDADIESIYFDSQPGIVEEFDEDAINALKDQIMSNPNTTTFGDASKLYDIDANFFDPEAFIEEQMELGNEPNIETGIIDFEPSSVMEENNIIQDAVEKNPWILRIMGNDYKYIRGWLWDLGVLNPKSDMYKKTDQLEQPE